MTPPNAGGLMRQRLGVEVFRQHAVDLVQRGGGSNVKKPSPWHSATCPKFSELSVIGTNLACVALCGVNNLAAPNTHLPRVIRA